MKLASIFLASSSSKYQKPTNSVVKISRPIQSSPLQKLRQQILQHDRPYQIIPPYYSSFPSQSRPLNHLDLPFTHAVAILKLRSQIIKPDPHITNILHSLCLNPRQTPSHPLINLLQRLRPSLIIALQPPQRTPQHISKSLSVPDWSVNSSVISTFIPFYFCLLDRPEVVLPAEMLHVQV